jgi:ABC-2 type transport system ATP-binding protein
MDKHIIQIKDLSFGYSKSKLVLNNINLNVPYGSIYGFIGDNGAGKTTTMRFLTGLIPDKDNTIDIMGQKISDSIPGIFNNIGSIIETPTIYEHLTGYDNLRYVTTFKRVRNSKIDEVLKMVDLSDSKNKKAGHYSLGMKQRLAIAMALIGDPELLILDEPVNGLDPNGIIDIRNLLLKLNREHGKTIFISSHLLDEVEKICTDIAIISDGTIRFEGTVSQLNRFAKRGCEVNIKIDNNIWLTENNEIIKKALIDGNTLCFRLNEKENISDLLSELIKAGALIREVKTNDNLESNFLKIITQ